MRLDKIMCSEQLSHLVQHTEYLGQTVSIHSLLLIRLNMQEARSIIPTWRLPVGTLEDVIYREGVQNAITEYFEQNQNSVLDEITEWEALKVVIVKSVGIQR